MYMVISPLLGYNPQMKSFAVEVGKIRSEMCKEWWSSESSLGGEILRALERGKR